VRRKAPLRGEVTLKALDPGGFSAHRLLRP
jgi:hypothetical protein